MFRVAIKKENDSGYSSAFITKNTIILADNVINFNFTDGILFFIFIFSQSNTHIINIQLSYGVKAVKFCASFEDFRKSSRSLYGFEDYCGPNVYGNNERMSGIIFIL